jgi:hypothetical protein
MAFAGVIFAAVVLLLLAWAYVGPILSPADKSDIKTDEESALNVTLP